MSPAHLIAWLATDLYVIRAIMIYLRLRTHQMPGEVDELSWQIAWAVSSDRSNSGRWTLGFLKH